MKALITGANGQLGRCLQASAPEGVQIIACGSTELDVTNKTAVEALLEHERPDFILNAAAYTAVDRAENEESRALAVNGHAVGHLAGAARNINARFVNVSTDFVFDGISGSPYAPDAATNPLSAYGRTKLAGEEAAGPDALIVRTAWVYAPAGGNFVRTMLRLMGERPEVRVVADQIGTPTYAAGLAATLWNLMDQGAKGVFHYTDSGVASWYDFAVAIYEEGMAADLLTTKTRVIPITTADFPTPAKRPCYSVLDKSKTFAALGGAAPHWRDQLRVMIQEICSNG